MKIDLDIKASEGKSIKVKGLAYDGGLLDINGGVVLDIEGLSIPESLPLLADHDNAVGSKVGEITASVKDGQVWIEGHITSEAYIAQNIIEQSKKGGKWQLSVGVSVDSYAALTEDTEINGRVFATGINVATKGTLREVSIVAVGAGADTYIDIAAKAKLSNPTDGNTTNKGADEMPNKEPKNIQADAAADIQAALKLERERIKAIKAVCDGDAAIEAQAIEAGWTADETAAAVLKSIRAQRPTLNVITKAEAAGGDAVVKAALMIRAGIAEAEILKDTGEQALEAGYKARNISIQDAANECIRAAGGHVGLGFGNTDIRAAFTTALPGILGDVANKRLQKAFKAYNPIALKLAQDVDLNDFKASDIYSIADFSNLTEVATSGTDVAKLAADKVVEHKGTNQLKTYGKIISLTRQQIINDDLGAFLRIADLLGTRSAKTIDQLFFAKLLSNPAMADENELFSVAHNNIVDIASNALSIDAVKGAIAKFLKQTGLDGEPVGVMPKYLVVPPELFFLAKEICESQYIVSGNTAKTAALNSVAGLLEAVQSPYLSNASYTGYSAADWYLFGDANELPAMEVGFLKGNATPTIEGSDAEFDTLGYSWRVYYDIGIGVADYRGVLKAGTPPVATSS